MVERIDLIKAEVKRLNEIEAAARELYEFLWDAMSDEADAPIEIVAHDGYAEALSERLTKLGQSLWELKSDGKSK